MIVGGRTYIPSVDCSTFPRGAINCPPKILYNKWEPLRVVGGVFSTFSNLVCIPSHDPWQSLVEDAYFVRQPALSPVQERHSSSWRRLSEAGWVLSASSDPLQAEDILQSIVSDCSVCASIAVCIDHDRRWGTQVQFDVGVFDGHVYWGYEAALPITTSPTGSRRSIFAPASIQWGSSSRKCIYPFYEETVLTIHLTFPDWYVIIIFGSQVTSCKVSQDIDDQLPSDPDGNLLCMSSGSKKQLLPSLIEKGVSFLMFF